jgi:hypothetical protein
MSAERWTTAHDLAVARMVPRAGQWAICGLTWHEGEWMPDGCFPIGWRDTREQAGVAATKILDSGQPIIVAEVVQLSQGFTLGEYHDMGVVK